MGLIDRSEWVDLSGDPLDSVDSEVVYQIAVRQRFAVDHYDTDGTTIITAREYTDTALAGLSSDKLKMVRGMLNYLDGIGVDTFYKAGGADGINFKPSRDADSIELDLCRIIFDRYEPLSRDSGHPYFA